MGNCQAAEAATVVIQHPGGRVERLYWATTAAEVMRSNPGHYVALVTLRVAEERQDGGGGGSGGGGVRRTVRLTRVKLLKPKETLLLGHVYRLITSHEVTKALQARKQEKLKKAQESLESKQRARMDDDQALDESLDQLVHQDRDGHRSSAAPPGARHHRQWRPSLHSIAEAGS